MSDPSRQTRMQLFERACRERGLPLTVHRRAVFDVILDRKDHPTADQVHAEVQTRLPGLSRMSVYRILDMLVATGMVNKVCHPGMAARYDPKTRQHHHLICLSCERIIDLEEPRLNRVPLPDTRGLGFEINDYHIHFRGMCADCLRKGNTKHGTARPAGRLSVGRKKASVKSPKTGKRRKP